MLKAIVFLVNNVYFIEITLNVVYNINIKEHGIAIGGNNSV